MKDEIRWAIIFQIVAFVFLVSLALVKVAPIGYAIYKVSRVEETQKAYYNPPKTKDDLARICNMPIGNVPDISFVIIFRGDQGNCGFPTLSEDGTFYSYIYTEETDTGNTKSMHMWGPAAYMTTTIFAPKDW